MQQKEILLILYVMFCFSPFILGFLFKILKRIKISFIYVKFANLFLNEKCYIPFEKGYVSGMLYKKELIKDLLQAYKRKYIRQHFTFSDYKFQTIKGYDIRKMDGVELDVIETNFYGGFIKFKKIRIKLAQYNFNFFISHLVNAEKNITEFSNNNKSIYFYKNNNLWSYDLDFTFTNVTYWRPVFTNEYRNWEEFNERFKLNSDIL